MHVRIGVLLLRVQRTNLLVEDTIVLVDVCDVALVLVESLAREFALLVDAKTGIRT